MKYWLFKTEPETFSWACRRSKGAKGEPWSGVRNQTATRNMKAMKKGDLGFFYHTGDEKAVVGIVEVIEEYPARPHRRKRPVRPGGGEGGEGHAQARHPGRLQGQSQTGGDGAGHSCRLSVQPVTDSGVERESAEWAA